MESSEEDDTDMPVGYLPAQTNLAVTAGPEQILKFVDQDSELVTESRL